MFSKNEVMGFQHQSVELLKHIEESRNLAATLMKTKHYQQLGHDGIFAVVQKAKSLNINPIDALNGGLYCVQGRVEMSAQLMNQLIRSKGHSIQKDPQSNKEMCFLHGKRADNGDVWRVSFGIEDAQRAGIYRQNTPWTKFPEVYLRFAREVNVSQGLESLDLPVLLAYGRFEFLVAPVHSWDPLRPKFKNLTVRIFEKSAHSPQYEEADLFDAELLKWVEET